MGTLEFVNLALRIRLVGFLYAGAFVFVVGYPIDEPLAAELTAQPTVLPSTEPAAADVPVIREREALAAFQKAVEKGKGAIPDKAVAKPPAPPRAKKSRTVLPATQTNQYDGYLRDAAVRVSLTINARTRGAEGDLYFLRIPDRLYTLKGQNVREKELRLTLFNANAAIAAVTLKRTNDLSSVRWQGEVHDSDGKTYPLFLSRSLTQGAISVGPRSVSDFDSLGGYQSYTGSVNNRRGLVAQAYFKLKIDHGACSGFYYQKYPNGQTSTILRLAGENKPYEKLTLRETDNDEGISAVFDMTKVPLEVSPKKIIWKGTLTNIRDNNDVKDVEFSRPR